MEPITRNEPFLAVAASDEDAPDILPVPLTREEIYWNELCGRIGDLAETSAEEISVAVTEYLNESGMSAVCGKFPACMTPWQRVELRPKIISRLPVRLMRSDCHVCQKIQF